MKTITKSKTKQTKKSKTKKAKSKVEKKPIVVAKPAPIATSKSAQCREMIDLGMSNKMISEKLGMHYSHVVSVKREYVMKQKLNNYLMGQVDTMEETFEEEIEESIAA